MSELKTLFFWRRAHVLHTMKHSLLIGLITALGQPCIAQGWNPYFDPAPELKLSTKDVVDACEQVIRNRSVLLLNSRSFYSRRPNYSDPAGGYFSSISLRKPGFMIPVLCELMCVRVPQAIMRDIKDPYYSKFIGASTLSSYESSIISRLTDIYISPSISSSEVQDEEALNERREVALSLLFELNPLRDQGQVGSFSFFRKQAEQYRTYATRTHYLAERAENTTIPNLTTPPLDARSPDQRLRRACEILMAFEDAQAPDNTFKPNPPLIPLRTAKPLSPVEEASLVKELGTLQQDFSASTLVGYLAKPVAGVDTDQVKGALLALGEPAIPELIRFMRCDDYSPESRLDALPLVVALCKSPQAAHDRLLQTAKAYEEGAKLFDDKATSLAR